LAYAGIGALGKFFGWSPELQSQAFLFAVAILLSIRSTALGILRLHDRFKTAAAADAVMPIMRFAGALTVLLAGPTLAGFLLAWALAEAVTALTCWLLAAKAAATSVRPAGPVRARKVLREHPGLAAFAGSTNVSFTLEAVSKQFSVVLVGIAAGPVAAGHYRIAYQVGQGLAKLSELLSRAVYAELTRVLFGELRDRLGKLFWSSVRLSAIASLAIVGILFLAGKPALLLVAGNAFEPAYPLLLLLGMAAALDFAGVNFQPALLATGKATLMLKLRLFVTASLLAALFLLLPRYGATGAAMATLTSSMIGLLLFGVAAWRAVRSA
jgi:O-antigen/teichoic acid export membrane protein